VPKLPIIVESQPVGAYEAPKQARDKYYQGIQNAWGGLARLGEKLQDIQFQNQKNEQDIEGIKVLGDLSFGLEQGEQTAGEAEHKEHLNVWSENAARVKEEALSRIGGFVPEVRTHYTKLIELQYQRGRTQALHEQERRRVDVEAGELDTSLDVIARLASKERDPEGRMHWMELAGERIGNAVTGRIVRESQAPQLTQRFREKVKKESLKYFTTEFQDKLDDLQNRALREPQNAMALFRKGVEEIDSAALDWLPEEKKEEVHSKFRDALWTSAVTGMIEADPYSVREALKRGTYDELVDQRSILHLRDQADNEIARRERKAEAERKEGERFVGKLVDDYEDAKASGFDWRGPVTESKLSEMVGGTEHEGKFQNVRAGAKILAQFNLLAPTAQEQYLRDVRTGAKSGVEAKFIGTLERAHQSAKEWLNKDPLTFAVRQRLVSPPPPLDLNNPETLRARSQAAGVVEQRYGKATSPLTDAETTELVSNFAKMPADARVATLRTLAQNLEPRHARMLASQLAGKGADEISQALGLSIIHPEVARRMLEGIDIRRQNKEALPKNPHEAVALIAEEAGTAYKNSPDSFAAMADAVLDIYAYRSFHRGDLSGKLVEQRLRLSIQEITGGVITYRGQQILPPWPGIDERGFRRLIEEADFSKAKNVSKKDILDHGILESIGLGKYLIRMGGGYVTTAGGDGFELDLFDAVRRPRE
jgi:hypothetical protein